MRISTPDSVRTAVLLLRYLVEVIDATIFRGAPSAAFRFTCASVALRTDIICAAGAIFSALLEESDAIRHSVPRAEIHPPRSRRPSLSRSSLFASCRSPGLPNHESESKLLARVLARRLARSRNARTVLLCKSLLVFLLNQLKKNFFPFPALSGAAGFKKYGPICQGRGIACAVLERTPSAGAGAP